MRMEMCSQVWICGQEGMVVVGERWWVYGLQAGGQGGRLRCALWVVVAAQWWVGDVRWWRLWFGDFEMRTLDAWRDAASGCVYSMEKCNSYIGHGIEDVVSDCHCVSDSL
jgi:hypothetical protein